MAGDQISIVVTTLNRVGTLQRILAPLLDDPATGELVLVSDKSSDGTAAYLETLARGDSRVVPVILTDNIGQPRARARGIETATLPVVLSLDDDVLVEAGCVTGHARRHARGDVDVVVGFMPAPDLAPNESPAGWNYAYHYLKRCEEWKAAPDTVLSTFWAGHFSVNREAYLKATAEYEFAAGYHEDMDLGLLLKSHGLRGVFEEGLRSEHHYRRTYQQSLVDLHRSGVSLRDLEQRYGRSPAADLPDAGGKARQLLVGVATSRPALRKAALGLTTAGVALGGRLRNDTVTLKAARLGWQLALLEGYAQGATGERKSWLVADPTG